jgi:hypothetical protein
LKLKKPFATRPLALLLLIIAASLLPACQAANRPTAQPPWRYADLRALDPADAPTPAVDLVALSLRHVQGQVQVRLDWLDADPERPTPLLLQFFSAAHPTQPILQIQRAANGTLHSDPDVTGLRLYEDAFYDTTQVAFDAGKAWLHAGYHLQAQALDPQTAQPLDFIGPAASSGAPPPAIPLLLAFWNTFDAVTPAQALRLWDGAHSGPGRERHGLRHLLEAVRANQIPVFLLDLKTPPALSALDAVGGTRPLQNLAAHQLALLPDVAPVGQAAPTGFIADSLAASRQTGLAFGLPASAWAYVPQFAGVLPPGYAGWVTLAQDGSPPRCAAAWPIRLQNPPAAATGERQATPAGPSLAVRRSLANATANPGYTLLGGDFMADAWGNPLAASATLRYLKARPWLQWLDAHSITPSASRAAGCLPPVDTPPSVIFTALAQAPHNALQHSAQQMLAMLLSPTDPARANLRQSAIGQVGHLLAAARWAASPAGRADCAQDLDWDGAAECVLASERWFVVIEPTGGYISLAALLSDGATHQVIAPSWQFGVGLADPMTWQPDAGLAADPAALPGAFFDPANPWRPFRATASIGQVRLEDAAGSKTFRVDGDRLTVWLAGDAGEKQTLVIALDAWRRLQPGWAGEYRQDVSSPGGWGWRLAHGPQVWLDVGEAVLDVQAFNASQPFWDTPEDPNFAYPAGHFSLFPLAVVTLSQAATVEISVR